MFWCTDVLTDLLRTAPQEGSTTIVRTVEGNFSATVQRVSRYPLPNATAAATSVSALTFSFNNLFNTSTEPIEIEESTLNLWSGSWDPCDFPLLQFPSILLRFHSGLTISPPLSIHSSQEPDRGAAERRVRAAESGEAQLRLPCDREHSETR